MRKLAYVLCIGPLAGVALALTCYVAVAHGAKPVAPVRPTEPVALRVTPETAIGLSRDFQGSASAPYTLVEFADYQCGPCIGMSERLPALLKKYPGRVRFVFRNFPLTTMHPLAMPAATAAEAAQRQGQFWPMHDGLFKSRGKLDETAIANLATSLHLNAARFARDRMDAAPSVEADMKAGNALGVAGTPTFLLCCADGRVFRLSSPTQMAQFVQ